MSGDVVIRPFREDDLEPIVEFSLRAWEPVYASMRGVLGEEIFATLYPDWRVAQADAIRASCTSGERTAFVATVDDAPAGFVTVWLNAFHDGMGVVDIIGVDPDHHRHGLATRLMDAAVAHMEEHGMTIALVDTGGDPGHAPARALYAQTGFTLLPIARYFRTLGGEP